MDRVKAQATQLAQQAQEAAQEGKARLDQAQARRRGDMLLRQLGALVFAERTGRGTADSQARIDRLISDLSEHERLNGLNLADPPQPGFGQSVFGQSVFGQASSAPPASQTPQGQPGAQPGFPANPPPGAADTASASTGPADTGSASTGPADTGSASTGPVDTGSASTGPASSPADGGHAMPSVDTTTTFFPAPDDEGVGGSPQA
jgi:hypothetical protein